AGCEAYRLCRYRATRSTPSSRVRCFVQPYVELIDDRRPVGILDPFLLEKGSLRLVPERGFGKLHVLWQGRMAGDEGVDAGGIRGHSQLFEESTEIFVGQFHVRLHQVAGQMPHRLAGGTACPE